MYVYVYIVVNQACTVLCAQFAHVCSYACCTDWLEWCFDFEVKTPLYKFYIHTRMNI